MTASASKTKKTVKTAQKQIRLPRFVADEHGRILYATPDFCDLIGQDSLADQHVTDLIEFVDTDEAIQSQSLFGEEESCLFDVLRDGDHDVRISAPNMKGYRTFSARLDRITRGDDERLIVGMVAEEPPAANMTASSFVEDLLKQANAQGSAAKSSKFKAPKQSQDLERFLELSRDLMVVCTPDGRFQRMNSALRVSLGYEDDELRDKNFLDLVYFEDRPIVRSCMMNVIHENASRDSVVEFEVRMMDRDGGLVWTEWRQTMTGGHLYAVGRDITAIKTHETVLKHQRRQLEEAQAIGHIGHWRWLVGTDSIDWSDELYRIFGVRKDEFQPTMDSVNNMLQRRDLGRLLQAFQRALIEKNDYDMEFRIVRPNGEERFLRCEGRCEMDGEGEVIALFGIIQDVTQHTLNEQRLREAKEAAERAYAAKSQFLANMSHELRTPLNAIIGFSEMMQRQLLGPIGTEKYLDYITGIRESGEHLLDLISDILDMSKIEAGKYELDLEELNLGKVIKLAMHMMGGRAQDARIKLRSRMENDSLNIVADRRAVMQILLNLLSNGVKFTEAEGEVCVEVQERETYVSVKVIDTGIGIPANKIRCITRPFEQAASHYTREHEGTGLGLAITKELVDMHGGSLHIESEVGKGTTVIVRLPYNAHTALQKKRDQSQKREAAKEEAA